MAVNARSLDPGDMQDALRRRPLSRPGEVVVMAILLLCAAVSLITTVLILGVLITETITFFQDVTLSQFFLETEWQPLFEPVSFGIWELVAGTLNVTFWALVFAVPLGLAIAIYLSEYARPNVRKVLKPVLEALASVPTVVFAYFALTFVTQDFLRPLLGGTIGKQHQRADQLVAPLGLIDEA